MDLLLAPAQDILKKSMLDDTAPPEELPRNVTRCAVASCTNDSNTEIGGRKLRLHSPPSSPRLKKFWIEAVPALVDQNKKVCEAHFLPQSSKFGMFPSLKLETRKRKQDASEFPDLPPTTSSHGANGNLPVYTVRKQVTLKPGFIAPLCSGTTPSSDSQSGLPLPRKVIRVIHKSNIIKSANDSRPMQAATATVTVARPINLTDIIGEKSNIPSTSTTPRNKTIDLNNSKTVDVSPSIASSSFTIPGPSIQKIENEADECSGDHEDVGKDSSCQKCISQLPAIRKSLIRLETRLDTMLTMARTLLARAHTTQNQFGQRPLYTVTPKSRMINQTSDGIPTVSNVKIVKKLAELPGGRKSPWPVSKKLI